MTPLDQIGPRSGVDSSFDAKYPIASIHGIATAYPRHVLLQSDVAAKSAEVFGHRPALMERMASAYVNSGVIKRHSCVPLDWYGGDHDWPERMQLFEVNAIELLTDAARRALAAAGVSAREVAATVTVSSTGVATPSLDSLIQAPLGLAPSVQRLPVFGLGCAGGVIGLSRAAAIAAMHPGRCVLFLCVELCGLTFRRGDDSKANIIGTTIFGDGAAAVVLSAGSSAHGVATIDRWGEHTWPNTRDIMGWRIERDGLGVVFSRSIPHLIRTELKSVSDAFLTAAELDASSLAGYIVHPGGEKVVSAIEDVYGLPSGALADARSVLAERGNMSAVTVLSVLEKTLARGARGPHLMCALGPGFSAGFASLTLRS